MEASLTDLLRSEAALDSSLPPATDALMLREGRDEVTARVLSSLPPPATQSFTQETLRGAIEDLRALEPGLLTAPTAARRHFLVACSLLRDLPSPAALGYEPAVFALASRVRAAKRTSGTPSRAGGAVQGVTMTMTE